MCATSTTAILSVWARDAFARLETLVPSIVHQRTANIFTDYDPYYRSWYQTDFNKTHAQYKGILLEAKLLLQVECICFFHSLNILLQLSLLYEMQ